MAGSTNPNSAVHNSKALERQLQGMVGMLSVAFLLGLAIATVAGYDADTHTGNHAVYLTLLVLHGLVAIGLFVGSIRCVIAARRQTGLSSLAVVGLLGVLLSLGTGAARASVDNEWLTFLMGVGFIVAMGVYGRLLGLVLARQSSEDK